MNRDEILEGLRAVGRQLVERGLQGDIYIVGGAAMALAYNERRVTKDVDAVFEPKMVIYEVAARVAEERGLPPDWLNDSVKGLIDGPDIHDTQIIDLPGLRCQVASAERLLALKVLARRPEEDGPDLRLLADQLDLHDADAVLELAERLLAPRLLTIQSQYFVQETMGEMT